MALNRVWKCSVTAQTPSKTHCICYTRRGRATHVRTETVVGKIKASGLTHLSHAKTEKCRKKAIRAFEKFSHGEVVYANPLQHCIYRLGPLESLVSQSRKQLRAKSVGNKSFVRKE